MPNQEHYERLLAGRDAWNTWRAENPDIDPELRSARLEGRNLAGYDLHDAYLRRAYLQDAVLDGCKLREANLSGAHLDHASLVKAEMAGANLRGACLRHADLSGADLKSAILVNTDLRKAKLNHACVYGIAAWEVNLEAAEQRDLVITHPGQPVVTADDLEVAQFLYVLLNHKKLRDVFNATTRHCVLILGRFGGGGLEVLHAVADTLRGQGYLPVIFDFERPRNRNFTETVMTLAGLSSFVVADLSGRSVPQELQATVINLRIPFVPILEKGQTAHAMLRDFIEHDHFLYPGVEFATVGELQAQIPEKLIAPALAYIEARQAKLRRFD